MKDFELLNKVRISGIIMGEPEWVDLSYTRLVTSSGAVDDFEDVQLEVRCFGQLAQDAVFKLEDGEQIVVDGSLAADEEGNTILIATVIHRKKNDKFTQIGSGHIEYDPTSYLQKISYNRLPELSYTKDQLTDFANDLVARGYPSDEDLQKAREEYNKSLAVLEATS